MRIFQPDRFLLEEFVAKNAKQLSGVLLDVGGQDGKRYRGYFKHADKYVVLDPDESCEPDIVASAEKMPLEDESIDSVLCMEMLMYVEDVPTAISEIARVLKPGGMLLMSSSFLGSLCHEPYDYWRFTPFSLKNLLQPYFEDIRIESRGGFRSQRVQNRVRYLIERYDLYKRPLIGRVVSIVSKMRGKLAIASDASDSSRANKKYAIGFNVLARKRA